MADLDRDAFTTAALVLGRFKGMSHGDTIAAIATPDGNVARLTYGHLRELFTEVFETGERLRRIASFHIRETASHGMVSDLCAECGQRWPCATSKIANGTHDEGA